MSFFRNFSLRWYDFKKEGKTNQVLITNFLHSVSVSIDNSDIQDMTNTYHILEGETIYSISTKLYKHPDYWWIIAILNNSFLGKNNYWPMRQNEFEEWIDTKYINIQPRECIKHYEKSDSSPTTLESIRLFYQLGDEITDLRIIQDFNLKAISIYDWEYRENEKRKDIIVPKEKYIQQIEREFQDKMLEVSKTYH